MRHPLKFIHTSDWQLGMTRAYLTSEASARFSQARIDAIRTLGELAVAHEAAFIVVAGDVFESNQLSRETLRRAVDALRRLPVPVFLLPGNHDPLDGSAILRAPELAEAAQVIVLEDMQPVPVPGVPGVEVVGAPWTSKRPGEDLCARMIDSLEPARGTLRVAVCHGQVDVLEPDAAKPETIGLAKARAALGDGRLHYLALGDRHSVTAVGDTGRIWYSGAPVATDFTEDDPNQALLVRLDAESCHAEPLVVGEWRFLAPHFAMNSAADVQRFEAWLQALGDPVRTIVKVSFEGSLNLAEAARLDDVLERLAESFASLRRRQRHTNLVVLPDALDEDAAALSGYARTTWQALQAAAQAGDDTARDALKLLYRLSRKAAAT